MIRLQLNCWTFKLYLTFTFGLHRFEVTKVSPKLNFMGSETQNWLLNFGVGEQYAWNSISRNDGPIYFSNSNHWCAHYQTYEYGFSLVLSNFAECSNGFSNCFHSPPYTMSIDVLLLVAFGYTAVGIFSSCCLQCLWLFNAVVYEIEYISLIEQLLHGAIWR